MELVFFRGVRVDRSIVSALEGWLHGHHDARLTSGYRSPAHNRAVGGAPRSWHLRGRAVDVAGSRKLLDHLEAAARRRNAVEVLREDDHLHVAF